MNLQKEREAFEKAFAQTEFYRNKADLYSLLADIDDETFDFFRKNGFGDYSIGEAQAAWSAWQATKAQADQKIKLLLCDEHLKKCESLTGVFNSQYPDEEPCLICLAKQYKAQAVPEGFVLVPVEPKQETIKQMKKVWFESNCAHIMKTKTAELLYKAMIEAQEQANESE